MLPDVTFVDISMQIDWQTGSDNNGEDDRWSDGTLIQNYAQFEDPRDPGQYISVTCNAEWQSYNRDSFASRVFVGNYVGDESFRVEDSQTGGPISRGTLPEGEL